MQFWLLNDKCYRFSNRGSTTFCLKPNGCNYRQNLRITKPHITNIIVLTIFTGVY